jgi:hypothetical protein
MEVPDSTFYCLHKESGVFGHDAVIKRRNMSAQIRDFMEEHNINSPETTAFSPSLTYKEPIQRNKLPTHQLIKLQLLHLKP